jgi:hypothetical protein
MTEIAWRHLRKTQRKNKWTKDFIIIERIRNFSYISEKQAGDKIYPKMWKKLNIDEYQGAVILKEITG